MMRFIKSVLPYALVAVGAIAAFGAGVYASSYFAGVMFNPRLGERELARLAGDHIVLQFLDAGNVNQARAFLVSGENGRILAINTVSPYLSDQQAVSACRLLRAVANFRITHPTGGSHVDNMVSEILQNPVACRPPRTTH